MAICLPGIASNVKRALTSEIRPAPAVTTLKLIINRIAKTTTPTAKLPPITTSPNAWITLPAASPPSCPCSNTTRVEATLSAKRNTVAINRTSGNIPKSTGFLVNTETSIMTSDKAMLKLNRISSSQDGMGKITIPMMARSIIGAPKPEENFFT